MNIIIWLFLLSISTVLLHSLIGLVSIPLQGSLVIDATGHSVICGIAIAFLFVHDLHSIALFIGALFSVFLMHSISKLLMQTKLLNNDVSTGVAFSFLFSLGIFLITIYARNIHLDLDMILAGNIELALYDQLIINGNAYGPIMGWISLILVFIILITFYIFWRPLNMLLFDKNQAILKGYPTKTIIFFIIVFTSYATVASLSVAGTIILVGISATPMGIWWTDSSSFYNVIVKTVIKMILLTSAGVIFSLWLDLPAAATIACTITLYGFLHILFFHKKSIYSIKSIHYKTKIYTLKKILEKKYSTSSFSLDNSSALALEFGVEKELIEKIRKEIKF